jgi:hypothetical protein
VGRLRKIRNMVVEGGHLRGGGWRQGAVESIMLFVPQPDM